MFCAKKIWGKKWFSGKKDFVEKCISREKYFGRKGVSVEMLFLGKIILGKKTILGERKMSGAWGETSFEGETWFHLFSVYAGLTSEANIWNTTWLNRLNQKTLGIVTIVLLFCGIRRKQPCQQVEWQQDLTNLTPPISCLDIRQKTWESGNCESGKPPSFQNGNPWSSSHLVPCAPAQILCHWLHKGIRIVQVIPQAGSLSPTLYWNAINPYKSMKFHENIQSMSIIQLGSWFQSEFQHTSKRAFLRLVVLLMIEYGPLINGFSHEPNCYPHYCTTFSALQLIDRTDLITCADASANWCCATNWYSKGLKNSCKLVRFQVNVMRLFTRCSRSNCLAPCNVTISSPATLSNNKSMESETSKSRDEAGTSAGEMPQRSSIKQSGEDIYNWNPDCLGEPINLKKMQIYTIKIQNKYDKHQQDIYHEIKEKKSKSLANKSIYKEIKSHLTIFNKQLYRCVPPFLASGPWVHLQQMHGLHWILGYATGLSAPDHRSRPSRVSQWNAPQRSNGAWLCVCVI